MDQTPSWALAKTNAKVKGVDLVTYTSIYIHVPIGLFTAGIVPSINKTATHERLEPSTSATREPGRCGPRP